MSKRSNDYRTGFGEVFEYEVDDDKMKQENKALVKKRVSEELKGMEKDYCNNVSSRILEIFEKIKISNPYCSELRKKEVHSLALVGDTLGSEAMTEFTKYLMLHNTRRLEELTLFYIQGYLDSEKFSKRKRRGSGLRLTSPTIEYEMD